MNLRVCSGSNEVGDLGFDAFHFRLDDRVAQPVTAVVGVEITAHGLPRRRPEAACFRVAQIKVAPVRVERDVVVAIAGQASQPGVAVERVPAACVRNQTEELFAAQIIDPRKRRLRAFDYVFALCVVKVTVFHWGLVLAMWLLFFVVQCKLSKNN